MYKTAVYRLVNGVITHQKQQISKRWYCSAVPKHLGNFMSLFVFLELEGSGLGLELGLGVDLGAIKLLIADCRYATHGNRVPVAGTGYTT